MMAFTYWKLFRGSRFGTWTRDLWSFTRRETEMWLHVSCR